MLWTGWKDNIVENKAIDWPAGFIIGSFTQLAFSRLFNAHFFNHTHNSLLMDRKNFKKEVGRFKWFELSPLLMLRGGVIGTITQTFN